jgi:gluconokinase
MNTFPISAYQQTLGMAYFARMLDKIRKSARAELHPDFHKNLGSGFDGRCTGYLRVNYEDLKRRTLEGGSDEEILRWCFQNGRELNADDIYIWNEFLRKRGWNDEASASLAERKAESGLSDRNEIQTMLEYFEFDEGRKA